MGDSSLFGKCAYDVPIKERILAKVSRAENGCWLWRGKVGTNGYAMFQIDRKYIRVHRASYQAFVGPIPAGLQIDHLCRNRACVNPQHLEPVTQRENTRRGFLSRKPTCPLGHEMTILRKGHRGCVICRRAYQRKQYAKHRERILARLRERYSRKRATCPADSNFR
jgi:hypothetical protein